MGIAAENRQEREEENPKKRKNLKCIFNVILFVQLHKLCVPIC